MNKRIKKYNYVKRENVVIATYLPPPSGMAAKRQIPLKKKKKIIDCNRKYDKILHALKQKITIYKQTRKNATRD